MSKRKITKEIQLVQNFKSLATAYQEISQYKMRLTRDSILKNREFLEEISEIFFDVKLSYISILALLLRHHRKNGILQFAGIEKNGKKIAVLVTANAKHYGTIVTRVFDTFFTEIQKQPCDIFILGKVGRALFDAKQTGRDYAYFEIPDTDSTVDTLAPLIEHLLPYEKVIVYYGKFLNVLSQTPVAVNISGDKPLEEKTLQEHAFTYLFEPHVEEILHFFQTQVFTSLFNQSVHEGELARHASRITSMEETIRLIEETVKILQKQEKMTLIGESNKRQLQQLSGMALWEEDIDYG